MSGAPDSLLEALDAAADDAARAALIAGLPTEMLEQLRAAIAYREMIGASLADLAAFADFSAALDSAGDDRTRLAVVDAARGDPERGEEFVQEWAWRRRASVKAWVLRYLHALEGDMR